MYRRHTQIMGLRTSTRKPVGTTFKRYLAAYPLLLVQFPDLVLCHPLNAFVFQSFFKFYFCIYDTHIYKA